MCEEAVKKCLGGRAARTQSARSWLPDESLLGRDQSHVLPRKKLQRLRVVVNSPPRGPRVGGPTGRAAVVERGRPMPPFCADGAAA